VFYYLHVTKLGKEILVTVSKANIFLNIILTITYKYLLMRILITLILLYCKDEYLDSENPISFIKVQNFIIIP